MKAFFSKCQWLSLKFKKSCHSWKDTWGKSMYYEFNPFFIQSLSTHCGNLRHKNTKKNAFFIPTIFEKNKKTWNPTVAFKIPCRQED